MIFVFGVGRGELRCILDTEASRKTWHGLGWCCKYSNPGKQSHWVKSGIVITTGDIKLLASWACDYWIKNVQPGWSLTGFAFYALRWSSLTRYRQETLLNFRGATNIREYNESSGPFELEIPNSNLETTEVCVELIIRNHSM
jgi:hypothetical protein